MRKEVPLIITFTIGLFMILEFFIPHAVVKAVSGAFLKWFLVIAAFAIVLGMANIARVNIHKIRRRAEGWGYNVVTIVALVLMLAVCLVFDTNESVKNTWLTRALGVSAMETNPGKWAFDSLLAPLSATMFSLLAFYIASAAYRAFRVRSLEAGLLLGAAVIVMFGRVPLGQMLEVGGIHAGTVSDWILNNPNAAAKRAILMGAAMGIISMGLKVILGLERAYLGGDR